MDSPAEVILTSDATNKLTNCSIYDAKTGTLMSTYKGDNSAPKTLSLISSHYLISASVEKPLLNVWTVSKKIPKSSAHFICPGSVTALSVSRSGRYCIGAIENKIYVWQVETGDLLAILSRHYQNITCFGFTTDEAFFLSGGEDGMVLVWYLSDVVSYQKEQDSKPHYSWHHHSAGVTDIYVGLLGAHARVATVSHDMTCKLYELATGNILCSVCMDLPLTSVAMDHFENFLLLGAQNGKIYKVNIFSQLPKELHYSQVSRKNAFVGHQKSVVCLSVSFSGKQILSGSDDKTCKVWDIETLTCLRTLHHEGPVTNAFFALKPHCLTAENVSPDFPIKEFSRVLFSEDDLDEMQTMYMSSKQLPVHLSLMHAGSPDIYFSPIVQPDTERHVDEKINGIKDAYKEMKVINAQMYSHMLNSVYKDLEVCTSDSD
ncbi:WD repeat-containing protein 18-like [Stegodyphus dumicola]|uniref:WD repeat-containing protein 18-like n=1 Tax=Stegodyphus dumicola TaxID=202533 RepID=UPI0015AE787E|nr:WD repeat-containing protein 18-like [Stegodyphus dumicola]